MRQRNVNSNPSNRQMLRRQPSTYLPIRYHARSLAAATDERERSDAAGRSISEPSEASRA
jgi:hypothetical protein